MLRLVDLVYLSSLLISSLMFSVHFRVFSEVSFANSKEMGRQNRGDEYLIFSQTTSLTSPSTFKRRRGTKEITNKLQRKKLDLELNLNLVESRTIASIVTRFPQHPEDFLKIFVYT